MFRSVLTTAAAAVALAGLPAAAQAVTFNFDFDIDLNSGDHGAGHGQLFADDRGDGTYLVTGANGEAHLYSPNYPDPSDWYFGTSINSASASWLDLWDDETIQPIITVSGATFTVNSLMLFDTNNPWNGYEFHWYDGNFYGGASEVGGPATFNLSLAPGGVPEAATWAMMLVGFGAVGAAMRRRTTVSFA
jgi:hypothetical protein